MVSFPFYMSSSIFPAFTVNMSMLFRCFGTITCQNIAAIGTAQHRFNLTWTAKPQETQQLNKN